MRESGYRVDTASNGAEALQVICGRVPNAIVLDVMMPRLNAYGFVARLRLTPGFASIPILIVTASYGAYEAAERLGAHACLTKPFELDELVDMVGQLVGELDPLSASNPQRSIAAEA